MVRIQPTTSENRVPTPTASHASEFEVQAHLYSGLKERGKEVRGEVKFPRAKGSKTRACRFDLVIYKAGVAVEIVEVKRAGKKHKNGVERTRQGCVYPTFGVPVVFIYGIEDANEYLRGFDD